MEGSRRPRPPGAARTDDAGRVSHSNVEPGGGSLRRDRAEQRMRLLRYFAGMLLLTVAVASLWPGSLTASSYDRQFRDRPNAPISREFPLGTDELGRDRLARLLYGTRVSLLAAPAAALISTLLAAFVGGLAGFAGGWFDRAAVAAIDLLLSLPWLFLLIIV